MENRHSTDTGTVGKVPESGCHWNGATRAGRELTNVVRERKPKASLKLGSCQTPNPTTSQCNNTESPTTSSLGLNETYLPGPAHVLPNTHMTEDRKEIRYHFCAYLGVWTAIQYRSEIMPAVWVGIHPRKVHLHRTEGRSATPS